MKKALLLILGISLVLPLCASKKGRPVRLGGHNHEVGKPKPLRSPLKQLVTLYQENEVLHVNVENLAMIVTVVFRDSNGIPLLQQILIEQESDVEIPSSATIVEVSYNDVSLIGIFY